MLKSYNSQQFEVERFIGLRYLDDVFHLKVRWKGLESSSWEPLDTLYHDAPSLVLAYLRDKDGDPRASQALLQLVKFRPTAYSNSIRC